MNWGELVLPAVLFAIVLAVGAILMAGIALRTAKREGQQAPRRRHDAARLPSGSGPGLGSTPQQLIAELERRVNLLSGFADRTERQLLEFEHQLDRMNKLVTELRPKVMKIEQSRSVNSPAAFPAVEPEGAPGTLHLAPGPTPTALPAPQPVEIQDGALVRSRSLVAPGLLVLGAAPGSPARLYLNEDSTVDHIALEQWSACFDFGGGKPYARYRTREPALVEWNESTGRGRAIQRGVAEAI